MNRKKLFIGLVIISLFFAPIAISEETSKNVVVIIGNQMFHDLEFKALETVFSREGINMVVASSKMSEAVGMGMLGLKVKPDITLKDIEITEYDAVVFVGGPGAHEFTSDYIAHRLVKKSVASGKVVAAIHLAPQIFANAGVLKGKKAVAYLSHTLKAGGAIVTDKMVEQDGNIITGRSQGAASEFAEAIVSALKVIESTE